MRSTYSHILFYRLCEIQPGDVVCDPMCGSGSISVQVSLGKVMLYVILCVDLAVFQYR